MRVIDELEATYDQVRHEKDQHPSRLDISPLSGDGLWWWDGSRWNSTYSGDWRWRYTGYVWETLDPSRPFFGPNIGAVNVFLDRLTTISAAELQAIRHAFDEPGFRGRYKKAGRRAGQVAQEAGLEYEIYNVTRMVAVPFKRGRITQFVYEAEKAGAKQFPEELVEVTVLAAQAICAQHLLEPENFKLLMVPFAVFELPPAEAQPLAKRQDRPPSTQLQADFAVRSTRLARRNANEILGPGQGKEYEYAQMVYSLEVLNLYLYLSVLIAERYLDAESLDEYLKGTDRIGLRSALEGFLRPGNEETDLEDAQRAFLTLLATHFNSYSQHQQLNQAGWEALITLLSGHLYAVRRHTWTNAQLSTRVGAGLAELKVEELFGFRPTFDDPLRPADPPNARTAYVLLLLLAASKSFEGYIRLSGRKDLRIDDHLHLGFLCLYLHLTDRLLMPNISAADRKLLVADFQRAAAHEFCTRLYPYVFDQSPQYQKVFEPAVVAMGNFNEVFAEYTWTIPEVEKAGSVLWEFGKLASGYLGQPDNLTTMRAVCDLAVKGWRSVDVARASGLGSSK